MVRMCEALLRLHRLFGSDGGGCGGGVVYAYKIIDRKIYFTRSVNDQNTLCEGREFWCVSVAVWR